MTVKELMESLVGLPDDMEVILQKDSGENGYSPLYCLDSEAVYEPSTTWCGEIHSITYLVSDGLLDDEEIEDIKRRPRCLVLFPIN